MLSCLRAQVIAVRAAAGYRHRETSLPVYPAGAFLVAGSDQLGASITVQMWDGSPAELAGLVGEVNEIRAVSESIAPMPSSRYCGLNGEGGYAVARANDAGRS